MDQQIEKPQSSTRLRTLCVLLGVFGLLCGEARISAAQQPPQWLTGAQLRRFEVQSQMTVQWANQSLRRALLGLSQQAAAPKRLAFMLDRRVDPDQIVELSVKNARFGELLDQLAKSRGLAVQAVDGVYYFGPTESDTQLITLMKNQKRRIRSLPKERQRALLKRKAINWDELAEPRELVAQLAKEGNLTVVGLSRVPHDLWPATALPPLTLNDRLTLVLLGFDLGYRLDKTGQQLEIVPLSEAM